MSDTVGAGGQPTPGAGAESNADVEAAVKAAIATADAAVAAANAAVGAAAALPPVGAGAPGVQGVPVAPGNTAGAGAAAGAAPGAAQASPDGTPASSGRSTGSAPGGNGDAAGDALGAPASSQTGAVRSPVVLFVGLGLVLVGGAVLAVRNRHRPGRETGT
jgi:hypothetical protein